MKELDQRKKNQRINQMSKENKIRSEEGHL